MIREVKLEDAAAIAAIYNEYVLNTTITFEKEEVSVEEMSRRIKDFSAHFPYFVYEEEGNVVGYAYIHAWKTRAAYAQTREITIYMKSDCRGRGIGPALLSHLIETCKQQEVHVLIACITEGNTASIALHEKFGFKQVADYKEVGNKFDRWIGVSDYELIL